MKKSIYIGKDRCFTVTYINTLTQTDKYHLLIANKAYGGAFLGENKPKLFLCNPEKLPEFRVFVNPVTSEMMPIIKKSKNNHKYQTFFRENKEKVQIEINNYLHVLYKAADVIIVDKSTTLASLVMIKNPIS